MLQAASRWIRSGSSQARLVVAALHAKGMLYFPWDRRRRRTSCVQCECVELLRECVERVEEVCIWVDKTCGAHACEETSKSDKNMAGRVGHGDWEGRRRKTREK